MTFLLLLSGGLLFTLLLYSVFFKQRIKKTSIYKNQKVYNLGRFCLAIISFCLTVLSSKQLFKNSEPLILLIYSFIAVTSLQIFWWNLTYNAQEDPLSSLFLKKEQRLDLRRANLSDTNLRGTNLRGANLRGANLIRADLSWANLSVANLSVADLSRADLSRAYLSEANLSEADLSRADLSDTNLSRANLSGANLSEADLSDTNLRRANLSGANLSEASLENNIQVEGANFTNAKGVTLEQIEFLIAGGAIFNDFS